MKKLVLSIIACVVSVLSAFAQLELKADFTDSTQVKGVINYPLNVFNRISPIDGFARPATAGAKLCIVRPLGGKYSNGGADLSLDTYLWDESKKEFYTDFSLLKKQIDGVFSKGFGIHQIVLDNPSWAFQRDSLGNLEGGELKVSTYGNAEPPRDYKAWGNYLKEVMTFLVNTYGKEKVLKIQYGIGREIGTDGHWKGTKEQFFAFYKTSVEAIHEVLPEARVGSHFLWETSKNAWGADFVKWCKTNEVHYDVIGASFYPFYNRADRVNFTEVYQKDFGAIKDLPEWHDEAAFEIHEFALIETMNAKGNGYESAAAKYQNSFLVGMMKMLFENNIKNLAQWGTGTQYMPANTEVRKLEGSLYYKSAKSGSQASNANYVDAIFTKDTLNDSYSVMAYNYNASPSASVAENLKLTVTLDVPPGTIIKYRLGVYQNNNSTLPWSDWAYTTTEGTQDSMSRVTFDQQLPVFSFLKYEFFATDEVPEVVDSAALVDQLLFYYPLENDGRDLSAKKNNATVGNAVTFSSGIVGNGAAFSYTDGSFLSSADSVYKYSYPTAYTIALWAKVSDYSQRGDLIQPTVGRTLLYSNGDWSFRSYHQKMAATFSVSESEKDDWFHVAMVIDQRAGQTQHAFYVNGVQRGTVAEAYDLETDKPQAVGRLIFGAASDQTLQRNFSGMLDEIYLFEKVLSPKEINYVMNSKGLIEYPKDDTAIPALEQQMSVSLYPNPVHRELMITGMDVVAFEIYNMMGALMKTGPQTSQMIDLCSLEKGPYLLRAIDSNGLSAVASFVKY